MKCPKCSFENPSESSYCMNCGTRLDGKIMCPNCRSLVEPDAKHCPHCGMKLPVEIEVAHSEKYDHFDEGRKRRDPVWQIVFTSVFVFLLAISLLGVFGSIISKPEVNNYDFLFQGTGLFYLTFEWGDAIKQAASTSSGIYKFDYIFLPIFRFVICLLNVLLTYSFGIAGIVKGIKQLKKKRKCQFVLHYHAAAVLASNIIAGACLLSTYSNLNGQTSLSTIFTGIMFLYSIAVFTAMVYRTYYRYSKEKKSLFIQNIIFSLGFILCASILTNTGNAYLVVDGVKRGVLDVFKDYIKYSMLGSGDDALIATICSTTGLSYFFEVTIRMFGLAYIIFFVKGFFLNDETDIKVKLPCYFGSILVFSLALILEFLTIGTSVLYKTYLLGYSLSNVDFRTMIDIIKNDAIRISVGGGISSLLSLSFIMLGTSMSSFIIVKTYKKNMKIIEARKVSK